MTLSEKMRLDALLVKRGFFATTDEALRSVLAGDVCVDDVRCASAGMQVAPDVSVRVNERSRFVSRGGWKLEGAFDAFDLDVEGLSCIDCGASTGGFTDCLLQHGAAHVCAVDVGYGDFAWSLRGDPRVSLFERTNIRKVDPSVLGAPFDIAVADISYAPLRSYIAMICGFLGDAGMFVTLVKPQFEASKSSIDAGGVVTDPDIHEMVLYRAVDEFLQQGLAPQGLCVSPICGLKGNNLEFLLFGAFGKPVKEIDVKSVVDMAHVGWDRQGEAAS